MDVRLHKIRTIFKKFILVWCLIVLFLVSLNVGLPAIYDHGPRLTNAQEEELFSTGQQGETPIDESYLVPTGQEGETAIESQIVPDSQQGESPISEYSPPAQTYPEYQPPAQQPVENSQPTVIDNYPECAGSPGMVHDVQAMSDGTYRTSNQHFQAGACGDTSNNQPTPQAEAVQNQQVPQSAPTVVRTYSECAGGAGKVHQVDQMSDGTYRTYNEHTQSGTCGDDGRDRDGASVVRTYSECAGTGAGRVHDVEQLTNGGYRTFNEHYQAGVCGDNPTPTPTATPFVNSYVDYRCEGTSQVYYRIYSDGRLEPTGQRDNKSVKCGYQESSHGSNFHGNPSFNQTSNQYPLLSISCAASPTSVKTGENVTWRVMTTGGSGSFNYRWSGENIDNQSGNTIFTSYNSAGNRTAQVAVRDTVTNNEVNTTCSVQILVINATSTPTPTPTTTTIITNPQIAQCPPGTIEKSRSGNQLICEAQNKSVNSDFIRYHQISSGPIAQCPSGTVEKSRNGTQLICETQNQVTIFTTPTPTPSPVQTTIVTAQQAVQCPSGTIEKSRTSAEIICERQVGGATTTNTNNNIVVNPSTAQTKDSVTVLSQAPASSVKELPKTGLPLAAVGMASLTPVGLRIRKLLKLKNGEESANSIWLSKQLKSDLI